MELRLPSEYQEVEYIENTGTQYIITDLLFPKELENPKIEWGFMQIATPSGDNMIFGYWSNGSIYYEVYNSTTLSYASIGKNHYDRISNSNLTKDMFIAGVMTKETMYLNGYSYATNAEDTIDQSVRPMAIFAWNSSSGRTYTNKGARIYYLRFYDGNTKMADYVPCYRKSDGEIGMYDTVTKTFYTNAGTDTFLKGADITRYIDNVSVLDTRRKILLNTPHIDTSVGDLVTFNTDLSAPLKSCKISFLPVQEGEGDPSPDNVREITGWNGIEGYISNVAQSYGSTSNTLTTTIDWTNDVGTVYGGYVDLVSGELVVEYASIVLTGAEEGWQFYGAEIEGGHIFSNSKITNRIGGTQCPTEEFCTHFPMSRNWKTILNTCIVGESGLIGFTVDNSIAETVEEFTQFLAEQYANGTPVQLVYKIYISYYTNYIIHQLTPQQLTALRGTNAIYFNTNGQIDIKYWIYFPKINYMKDAEWLDHSYITSAGKLIKESTALSHTTVNSILLSAGNYRIYGFCYQEPPASSLNCRVHEYSAGGNWIKLITSNAANTMSPYILEFSLDHDSYIKLSLPRMLGCKLIKLY